jgi:hypothetical protein
VCPRATYAKQGRPGGAYLEAIAVALVSIAVIYFSIKSRGFHLFSLSLAAVLAVLLAVFAFVEVQNQRTEKIQHDALEVESVSLEDI